MLCIDQSMVSIKEKTNRDVLWAAVAYQDFAELKKLGGKYH
jgi:myosin protein heavy chain